MERYKIYLAIGLVCTVLTVITACSSAIPSPVPGVLMVMAVGFLFGAWKEGKGSFLNFIEEDRQLAEGLEKKHKIQITMDTTGCNRDEAIGFLNACNWDEVKIFIEFRKDPERFYNAKIGSTTGGKTCPRCGTICPSHLTFCVNCEGILKKLKDTISLREDMVPEKTCPSCNSVCHGNYSVCPHCNSLLNEPLDTAVPPDTDRVICDGCGALCNESLSYCPSCEKPLRDMKQTVYIEPVTVSAPVIKCPACGTVCGVNLKYCTECGKNL